MNNGWSNKGGGSNYEHPSSHPANMIIVADTANNFTGTDVETVLTELFQSGNSGKNSIETAVVSKGGTVSKAGSVATFAELTSAINTMPIGGLFATGTVTPVANGATDDFLNLSNIDDSVYQYKIIVNNLSFRPDEVIYWQTTGDWNFQHWNMDRIGGTAPNRYTLAEVIKQQTTSYYRTTLKITNPDSGAMYGVASINSTGFVLPASSIAPCVYYAYKRP